MKTILISFACMIAITANTQSNINWHSLFDDLLESKHHRKIQEHIISGGFIIKDSDFKGTVETRTYQLKTGLSEQPMETISYVLSNTIDLTKIGEFNILTSNLNTIIKIKKEFESHQITDGVYGCNIGKGEYYQYTLEKTIIAPDKTTKKISATCVEYMLNNRLQFEMKITVN